MDGWMDFCELQSTKSFLPVIPIQIQLTTLIFSCFYLIHFTNYMFHICNVKEEESDSHHRPGVYIYTVNRPHLKCIFIMCPVINLMLLNLELY